MWKVLESSAYLAVILSAAAMGLLAAWVTFRPPKEHTHWKWMFVFAALSALGITAAIVDHRAGDREKNERDNRSSQAQSQLRGAMDQIAVATREIDKTNREIARVQTLNTQLQKELLEQSHALTELSRDAIKTATGGDSFC